MSISPGILKYNVVMVADSTSGPRDVKTTFDDEGELRDNVAAWLQFDFVREIHITIERKS